MNFEINKEDNKVEVKAKIKKRKYAREPHSRVETQNVLDFLTSEGYNVKEWKIIKTDLCSTVGKEQRLTGTWIFEKIVKQEKTTRKVLTDESTRTTGTKQQSSRNSSARKKKTPQLLRNEDMGRVQLQAQTDLPGQDKEISGE